eukprot:scaffold1669_cov129-Cylindrotheca_fusiformis.AAC.31
MTEEPPIATADRRESSPLLGQPEDGHGKYSGVVTLPTYASDEDVPSFSASTDSVLSDDVEYQLPVKDPSRKKKKTLWEQVDKAAFQFALRMSVLLWFSSLFVLIRTDSWNMPDGMWVLVTVLFVSWFPQLDAASVIEKIIQRLLGTFLGAFIGLACGFASLLITDHPVTQSIFLGSCVFIFTFLIIFVAGQCKVGRVKVIKRFAYATILCVLTFCICIMPFSMDEDPKWGRAMYRVLNVIVGCGVGALGSILIVPKSTTDVLYAKASRQVGMAGEAADAVMSVSADFFAGRIQVNRLADELLNTPLDSELKWRLSSSASLSSRNSFDAGATDVALKKYEDAIADWRLSKMLFPLVQYDPFKFKLNAHEAMNDVFHTEIARTLARCLRIQTTIVVLDGMVRSDADYDFCAEQLESFSQIGKLIHRMLTVPLERDASNAAANILFVKLEETRKAIHRISTAVADSESGKDDERDEGLKDFRKKLMKRDSTIFETLHTVDGDDMGRGIPANATGRDDNTLFFLQLVEHMILRSLRLYQAWTHVESIRNH